MDENTRKEIVAKIKKLRLMDDFFMVRFFEGNIEATDFVLKIILNRNDIHVKSVQVQQTIKSIAGRGVCLDVLAVDDQGKYYNIEVQRDKDGACFRRARLNSSLLDNLVTKEGDDYKDLPETYIIFITEKDIFGDGYPVYEIENTIKQNNKKIDDGVHVLYVNGAYRGNDDMGKLMEDFNNPEPESMNYEVIKMRSIYLKEDEKGVTGMCVFSEALLAEGEAKGIAKGKAEGRAEGKAEGKAEEKSFFAEMMLRANEPISKIRQYTQLSLEKIQEIAKSIGVAVVM